MAAIESFRDLIAWQKGMFLAEKIYRATEDFPRREQFGLAMQLRKAAVSVPSNIAEGFGRHGRADYLHFLNIARGSLNEVQTQIEIAERVGVISGEIPCELQALALETARVLKGLINGLRNKGSS
ncbi:MAG TPA: four helix bundle protein [Phycisphaerae bacterium]|nr:four helix bundle protein [Phycisphaerae bacterium]